MILPYKVIAVDALTTVLLKQFKMTSLKVVSAAALFLSCVLIKEGICQTGLSNANKQDILNAHNNLRGQVSPSASNIFSGSLAYLCKIIMFIKIIYKRAISDHVP